MKLGQLIEYNYAIMQKFKNYAENEAGRLVLDLFIFKKSLIEKRASGLQLSFNLF